MTLDIRPVRQGRRIAVLRAAFLLGLPILLLTRSSWGDTGWLFETFEVLGILLIIAGVLGRLWAILYIGRMKNAGVMAEGPYSICRHPLYLFSTVGTVGFGLMLGSVVLALGLGLLIGGILWVTAGREERFLRSRFGAAYDDYARRVPRLWPSPRLHRSPQTIPVDTGTLRRNLADALVFLALIPLAELVEGLQALGGWPTLALW